VGMIIICFNALSHHLALGLRERGKWVQGHCTWFIIQSVQGGKVNILVGHSIGHSKQKRVYVRVLF
jgi:hypothetical protein